MNYKIIGENKRALPHNNPMLGDSGVMGIGTVDIIVVLVEGGAHDYAAYICGGDDPQFAAAHGNKISFTEAQAHFCNGLDEKKYRS